MGKIVFGLVIGGLGLSTAMIGSMWYLDNNQKQVCTAVAKPESYNIRKQNIDQIFRDHNGYRLYWHDEEGRVKEESFGPPWNGLHGTPTIPEAAEFKSLSDKESFLIFKDLPEGEALYAKILTYQLPECNHSDYHVEVHMPANQSLAPGIDSYISGKATKYEPMHEIK